MDSYNKLYLAILAIIGVTLRLIVLDQSFWLDEATTAKVVSQFNFGEIIPRFSVRDFHPPGYYLLLKVWTSLFGYDEVILRLPSVLASVVLAYLIFLYIKTKFNLKIAIWAMALWLLNPLAIYYAQEARMYSLVTLFLFTIFWLAETQKLYNIKFYFLLVILIIVAVASFYGSVLFLLAYLLVLIYRKKYKLAQVVFIGLLVVSLFLLPLFWAQWRHAQMVLGQVLNWKTALGNFNLKNLFLIPFKFLIGRITSDNKIIYYLLGGGWTAINLYFVCLGFKKGRFLLVLLVLPITFAIVIAPVVPMLQYFRFLYLLPFLIILIALGLRNQLQFAIVALGFFICSLIYLVNSDFHREDWRTLASYLPNQVYMMPDSGDPIRYYRPDISIMDLRKLKDLQSEIVVIPYTSEIYGYNYQTKLKKLGFALTDTHQVRGVYFELWRVRP